MNILKFKKPTSGKLKTKKVKDVTKGRIFALDDNYTLDLNAKYIYHGGKKVIKNINKKKLQSNDKGFFGKGFYATAFPNVALSYGKTVSKFKISPDSKILNVPMNVSIPADIETVKLVSGKNKITKKLIKKLYTTHPVEWKGKFFKYNPEWAKMLDKYAKKHKIDMINLDLGEEILVKNFSSIEPMGKFKHVPGDDLM